jgi:hypothetical protein
MGTRLDLDLETGFPVKALPQRRIIAGELELCGAVKLEHERVRRTRGARHCR